MKITPTGLVACFVLCFLRWAFAISGIRFCDDPVDEVGLSAFEGDAEVDVDNDNDAAQEETFNEESSEAIPSSYRNKKMQKINILNYFLL